MLSKPSSAQLAEASSLRKQLRRELDALATIAHAFFEREPLVRGQVYETARRCGKPTCHCAEDRGHPVTLLSVLAADGRKTRGTSPRARDALAPLCARYRRFREARAAFGRWSKAVLRLVDALEASLTADVDLEALRAKEAK